MTDAKFNENYLKNPFERGADAEVRRLGTGMRPAEIFLKAKVTASVADGYAVHVFVNDGENRWEITLPPLPQLLSTSSQSLQA